MKWLLIFVLTTGSGFGGGPTSNSVQFESEAACKRVLTDMKSEAAKKGVSIWAGCYPDR